MPAKKDQQIANLKTELANAKEDASRALQEKETALKEVERLNGIIREEKTKTTEITQQLTLLQEQNAKLQKQLLDAPRTSDGHAEEKVVVTDELESVKAELIAVKTELEYFRAELKKSETEKEEITKEKEKFGKNFSLQCAKFIAKEETLNKRIEELKAEVVATKQSALTRPSRVKDARMPSAEASSSTSIVDGGIGSRRSASSHYVTSLMQQQQPDDATVLPKEVMVADFMREQQQRCLGSASSYPGVMFGFSAIGGSASGGIEGYVPEDKQAAAKQEKKSSSKPAAPRPSQG